MYDFPINLDGAHYRVSQLLLLLSYFLMLHIENKFENVEWTSIITSIKKKKLYKRKEGRKIKQKGDPEEVEEPYKCWLILF